MRLDRVRLVAFRGGRLDDVGIDRALREPADLAQLRRFALEHLDEEPPDDLALALRIVDAGERRQELVGRIDVDDANAEMRREGLEHLLGFVAAQEAVIDEHARELVADRAMQESRRDRRIDAAGQAEQHFVATNLRADRRNRLADVVVHVPVVTATADVVRETGEDRRTLLRVRHLGMELHAVEAPLLVGHRRDRARG